MCIKHPYNFVFLNSDCYENNKWLLFKKSKIKYIYIFPNSLILYIVYWPVDNFPTSREFIFWKRGLTLVLLKSSGTIPVATDFLTMDKIGYLI